MSGAKLGDVAEDADLVAADLDETTVHGGVELAAIGQRDSGVRLRESTEERRMARQEGDLATAEGARDHLGGLTREHHPLGRHQLDLHRVRHQEPSVN